MDATLALILIVAAFEVAAFELGRRHGSEIIASFKK